MEGGPLTKQYSNSLQVPSAFLYEHAFRRISEVGWLEIKNVTSPHNQQWEKRWFEFSDGTLKYSISPTDTTNVTTIPIEDIIRLVTDNKSRNTIVMKTLHEKICLRTESPDDMNRWIFAFQKSVAMALTRIKSQISQGIPQSSSYNENELAQELGNGHGSVYKAVHIRHELADHAARIAATHSVSLTHDDIVLSMLEKQQLKNHVDGERSFVDLTSIHDKTNIADNNSHWSAPNTPAKQEWSEQEKKKTLKCEISDGSRSSEVSPTKSISIPIIGRSSHEFDNHDGFKESAKLAGSLCNIAPSPVATMGAAGFFTSPPPVKIRTASQSSSDSSPLNRNRSTSKAHSDDMSLMFTMEEDFTNNGETSSLSPPPALNDEAIQPNNINISWIVGSCSKIGVRSKNEDRLIVVPNLHDDNDFDEKWLAYLNEDALSPQENSMAANPHSKKAYFGVYDGHCGVHAAAFLQSKLHQSIYSHPMFFNDMKSAIFESCLAMDDEYLECCKINNNYDGTTALGAFIVDNELTVFNVGDCQAVLCQQGEAILMNTKHNPNRPDESERIIAAKGWITEERELYYGRLRIMDLNDPDVVSKAGDISWTSIFRVCGDISVSRSIGDPDYKGFKKGEKVKAFFKWPDDHDETFDANLLIPDPEFMMRELDSNTEFLILATDGIWDVLTPEDAIFKIKSAFVSGKSPDKASEELCELALKLGSVDNVTAVIVKFQST